MKKEVKYYAIVWVLAVIVFHLIMFLLPDAMLGTEDSAFWIIYVTVMVSFAGQAVCSYLYASKKRKEERFLYIPVVLISYIALLMTLLLALQALTLRFLPDWFTIIVALLVTVYYVFAVLRTLAAAEMVVAVDEKVRTRTDFMKRLETQAKTMQGGTASELQPLIKRVYESIRYSDPMSVPELAGVEEEMQKEFEAFADAVKKNQKEAAEQKAEAFCAKNAERNALCKQLK